MAFCWFTICFWHKRASHTIPSLARELAVRRVNQLLPLIKPERDFTTRQWLITRFFLLRLKITSLKQSICEINQLLYQSFISFRLWCVCWRLQMTLIENRSIQLWKEMQAKRQIVVFLTLKTNNVWSFRFLMKSLGTFLDFRIIYLYFSESIWSHLRRTGAE